MWNSPLIAWLMQSTLSCAVILAIGSIAMKFIPEPVYRIGIIRWTFAACLLVPLLRQCELLPLIPLRILPVAGSEAETAGLTRLIGNDGLSLAASGPEFGPTQPAISRSAMDTVEDASQLKNASKREPVKAAEATVTSSLPVWHWSHGVRLAYASVLIGVVVYWIVGLIHRRRIERSSVPASDRLCEILASIAGNHAASRVRLLTSDCVPN